ncbi:MAG: ammonium transporter [Alphaproteobacteria bacterium]|nr:ammonium transporter [Alphaproteobacteria bacterium]
MQGGFLCLETGFVRAKNGINVAVKNVLDFCIAALLFWAIGFGLMFGDSWGGFVGVSAFFFDPGAGTSVLRGDVLIAFFFFQMAFCGTATTIVLGAVAERMSFRGYVLVSALLSGLIYPVFGHWAWGGAEVASPSGWLAKLGFIDFAGSTVVHSMGAWVSLAAIIILGPRIGRYGEKEHRIEGHNIPYAGLGVMLLWFGWFGFNGGSTLAFNDKVAMIIVHTTLAGAAGGVGGLVLSWSFYRRSDVPAILNGVIAGLVGITACCHVVDMGGAILVGATSSAAALLAQRLLDRLHIDDTVGAAPAHLAAGIWGTLCVALVGDPGAFGTGHDALTQLGVQAIGIGAAAAIGFGVSFPVLWLANRFHPLRVPVRAERVGLNVAEHGASSALLDLLAVMESQRMRGDFSDPVPVEPHTEAGEIAAQYNRVLERFNDEVQRRERTAQALERAPAGRGGQCLEIAVPGADEP